MQSIIKMTTVCPTTLHFFVALSKFTSLFTLTA